AVANAPVKILDRPAAVRPSQGALGFWNLIMFGLRNDFSVAADHTFGSNEEGELAEFTLFFFFRFLPDGRFEAIMIVNVKLAGGYTRPRRDVVADDVILRIHFFGSTLGVNAFDRKLFHFPKPERHKRDSHVVARHVPNRPGSEVAPVPPAERVQPIMILAIR